MPRFSIPTRIFLGFAFALTAFVLLLLLSIYQHQRTAKSLRLMEEGYVPLAITVGEAKATQSLFATLLDRFLKEQDPTATRHWLNTARRLRPATVRRALYEVDRAFRLQPDAPDASALRRVRAELKGVQETYAASDAHYDNLFAALTKGELEGSQQEISELQNEERNVRNRLQVARDVLEERLSTFSANVAERERHTAVLLLILTTIALIIAAAVTWWSQRILAPLPRLQERVLAVARGDLERRLEPMNNDELGSLANEFERMVDALATRDHSLRDAHEEQLATRARLMQSERLAAIGRMASHVTHEVRNPLSSIRLNVELLEEDMRDAQGETRGILTAIHKEIDRLTDITEEYLRLARVPQPRLDADDLGDLVRSVASFVMPEFQGARVNLHVEVAEGLPPVGMDEPQLRQVLMNLLRNAREAMPDGGDVWATVARADDGGVTLAVRDNGPGVPAAERDHIFELFFTTKERGTGLGLPLTQQIVVAHRGHIVCEENPGGGAVFRIWFPAADPVQQTA